MRRGKRRGVSWRQVIIVGLVVALVLCVSACSSDTSSDEGSTAEEATTSESVESEDSESSVASADLSAEQWADLYPLEYKSYCMAAYADYTPLPESYGFSDTMVGKKNTMTNAVLLGVAGAGCVSCHSTSFVQLVAEEGGDYAVSLDVDTLISEMTESITCYSCHGDTPGTMVVSKWWIEEAAEEGGIETDEGNLVCAQCHSLPDWSNIMTNGDESTWTTLSASTDADAVWAYFEAEGFTEPDEAAGGFAIVTEDEFNAFYGSTMEAAGATCSDCHMQDMTSDDGEEYSNHAFQGADDNEELWNNCLTCHTDSTAEEREEAWLEVKAEYDEEDAELSALMAEASELLESSSADEATIEEATSTYNKALFYYQYGSDAGSGIHMIGNSNVDYCWDTATELSNEVIEMLS